MFMKLLIYYFIYYKIIILIVFDMCIFRIMFVNIYRWIVKIRIVVIYVICYRVIVFLFSNIGSYVVM